MNKVVPDIDERRRAIEKYSKRKPRLKWGADDQRGVLGSGWNPLGGVNVCFRDESESRNTMWIVIELPAPGMAMSGVSMLMLPCIPLMYKYMVSNAVAIGCFFTRNPVTGQVDLLYRLKPFRGQLFIMYIFFIILASHTHHCCHYLFSLSQAESERFFTRAVATSASVQSEFLCHRARKRVTTMLSKRASSSSAMNGKTRP
jgi:hypothetical protein